jgi:hypothetical protein
MNWNDILPLETDKAFDSSKRVRLERAGNGGKDSNQISHQKWCFGFGNVPQFSLVLFGFDFISHVGRGT